MSSTETNIDVAVATLGALYSTKRFPNVSPALRCAMYSVELALAEKVKAVQELGVDSGTPEMRAELDDALKISEVAGTLMKVLESNEERLRP